jgi:hypothetical protein
VKEGPRDLVRLSAAGCAAAAVLALLAFGLTGSWGSGVALALGLLLGGVNAVLLTRSLQAGIGFRASSLGRLGALSLVGLGVGFLLVPAQAWLVAVGLGAAQLVLVALAARELVRT